MLPGVGAIKSRRQFIYRPPTDGSDPPPPPPPPPLIKRPIYARSYRHYPIQKRGRSRVFGGTGLASATAPGLLWRDTVAFIDFFRFDQTMWFLFTTRNDSGSPADADALPTFRIYGEGGLMTNGTGSASLFDSSNTDGLYKVSKTILQADGYERGKSYVVRVLYAVNGKQRAENLIFAVA